MQQTHTHIERERERERMKNERKNRVNENFVQRSFTFNSWFQLWSGFPVSGNDIHNNDAVAQENDNYTLLIIMVIVVECQV